ncbi:hypothetical protein PENTCL1PPCAC_20127 [Pristionchus entomophagus]|uniref:Cytochrome P450 n=1 Tax=Pristionchus entomophagus TaxID=358040 RepID=A0AAV5TUW3_9BILA|nr:hypothetical protein PENTCL1PPCAC_20127 [Pristionchus entomophagus]
MLAEFAIGFILFIICYSIFINRIRGLPPGPVPLPLVGNLLSLSNEAAKDLLRLSKKYGPVLTVWMPQPVVVITDSKVLHESIIRGGDTFGDRPQSSSHLIQMFDPYGAGWKEQRRFSFQSFKEVGFLGAEFRSLVSNYAQEVILNWKRTAAKDELVDVTECLQSAVSNVMWRLTFGRTRPMKDPFFKHISEVTHRLSLSIIHPCVILSDAIPFLHRIDFLLGNPLKTAENCRQEALEITKQELLRIESSCSEDEPTRCYVQAFLNEIEKRSPSGTSDGNFTRDQLLLSATSHWIAGIETTVTTLRFGIHFLCRQPEVQRKMQEEIDERIGQREIFMEDQKHLPYCMATILEIQRLANVGQLNFFRLTNKDSVIGGHHIPAGSTILPQFPSVHVDSDVFDHADELNPDRFLNDEGAFVKDPRVTPFSMGVRACPGEGLAKMELFLLLTSITQHLTFSNPDSTPSKLLIDYGLTKSLEPFTVKITAR